MKRKINSLSSWPIFEYDEFLKYTSLVRSERKESLFLINNSPLVIKQLITTIHFTGSTWQFKPERWERQDKL